MRNWIDLIEGLERRFARTSIAEEWIGTAYTGDDVFRNPSRAELNKLIRTSSHREVRAFLSSNLYVWNSEVLHHDFPMELLAPEDASCTMRKGQEGRACINLHIGFRGPYISFAEVTYVGDDETPDAQFAADKAFVENHPVMRRLFGNFDLRIEE